MEQTCTTDEMLFSRELTDVEILALYAWAKQMQVWATRIRLDAVSVPGRTRVRVTVWWE